MDWRMNNSLPWHDPWNYSAYLLDAPEFEVGMYGMVSTELKVAFAILYGFVGVLGLAGNVLVLVVILTDKTLWRTSRIGLLNLAVADIVFLSSMPMVISNTLTRSWTMGLVLCKLFYGLHHVGTYAAMFTLVYLRVIHILTPTCQMWIKNYLQTRRFELCCSAFIWLAAILGAIPVLLFVQLLTHPNGTEFVFMLVPKGGVIQSHKTFVFYTFGLGYAAPLALILVTYLIPFFTTGSDRENQTLDDTSEVQEPSSSSSSNTLLLQNDNENILVTLLVSLCLTCVTPSWICSLYSVSNNDLLTYRQRIIFGLLSIVAASFSAIKPIVYVTSEKRLYSKLCTMLCRCYGSLLSKTPTNTPPASVQDQSAPMGSSAV